MILLFSRVALSGLYESMTGVYCYQLSILLQGHEFFTPFQAKLEVSTIYYMR